MIQVDQSKAGFSRDDIRLALQEENIESRPTWKPMHLQPLYKSIPFYGSDISNTLFDQGLCLPSGSNMTNKDFNRIKAVLTKFLQ